MGARRAGCLVVAVCLTALGVALGWLFAGHGVGEPATTEGLLARYAAHEDADDFRVHGTLNLRLGVSAALVTVPITLDASAAAGAARATFVADLSGLGAQSLEGTAFVETGEAGMTCYVGTPAAGGMSWRSWSAPSTSRADPLLLTRLLAQSTFSRIARDSDELVCFELAIPSDDLARAALATLQGAEGSEGSDEMWERLSGEVVWFDFTEECLLRSVTFDVNTTLHGEGSPLDVSVRLGAELTLADYGTVDASEVAVPDEVREAATGVEEPLDLVSTIEIESPLVDELRALGAVR